MRPRSGSALLLCVLIGLGTWFGGWWAVPLAAAWWGWRGGRPVMAGLVAALTWGLLLALYLPAPLGRLLRRVGALGGVSQAVPVLITLGFVALLGWSAARVAYLPRPARRR